MKRKFLVLLCIVMIVAVALASCKNDENDTDNDTCEHTFSESWSTNSTDHWHAATCEHSDEKSALAPHADADEDGKCDVCAYTVPHTHTFATTWSSDYTRHWHAATCSHTSEKADYAAHVDANVDNACDVCSAPVATNIETGNFASVIATLVNNAGGVKAGNLAYTFFGQSAGTDGTVNTNSSARYEFGNNCLYMVVTSTTTTAGGKGQSATETDTIEYWYELISAEEIFCVVKESADADLILNTGAAPASINGYYCAVSTLTDAYGAENLLATMYAISQLTDKTGSTISSDYTESFDEATGVYTFSFNTLVINRGTVEGTSVDYYESSVSFTHHTNGVLKNLTVVCNCYTNSIYDDADCDFDFDEATETITLRANALADVYTFTFDQEIGNRTYVNEYPMSGFIPTDFELFLDEELTTNANGQLTLEVGEVGYLYLGAYLPAGANISFIPDSFLADVDTTDGIIFTDAIDESVLVRIDTAGTYTLTITAGEIIKTVTLTITEVSGSGDVEIPENSVAVYITDNNTYVDLATFTAPESGTYSFFVPAGCGAWDKEGCDNWSNAPYVDPYDQPDGDYFTITLAQGKTYEFYVLSPDKNVTVYLTYNFVAHEVEDNTGNDDGDDNVATTVVPGTYTGTASANNVITLVVGDGTLTVTLSSGHVCDYTFTVDNGVVTLSNANGPIAENMAIYFGGLIVNGDGVPTSFLYNGYTFSITTSGSSDSGNENKNETLSVGNNSINVTNQMINDESKDYTFVVTEEGTYTFTSNDLMANILDSNGILVGRGTAFLAEGTYTISVYFGNLASAGTYNLSVVYTAPSAEEGTQGNPKEIDALPFNYTLNSNDDLYFMWVATEDCTLVISGGCYAVCTDNNENYYDYESAYDSNDKPVSYTVTGIKAGDIVIINLWYYSAGSVNVNITVA